MNLGNVGWSGLILIVIALLFVFGPSKLPEISKAFGKSLREFKQATKDLLDEMQTTRTDGADRPMPARWSAATRIW